MTFESGLKLFAAASLKPAAVLFVGISTALCGVAPQAWAASTPPNNQTTPVITWHTPAAITYGTALGGKQLDASTTVAGAFVYTPAAGAVLGAGAQTLSVTFTPTDTADYTSASATVQLAVNKAVLMVAAFNRWRGYGHALPTIPYTYSISGYVNGDTAATAFIGAPGDSSTAAAGSPPGTYPITPTIGT